MSTTIVESGSPNATIVIGRRATGTERFAAQELQLYIHKASGAALTIKEEPITSQPVEGNVIAIGRNRFNDPDELGLGAIGRDGFCIRSRDGLISIAGADDEGTLFGVYTFLEEQLGVRWLWPGELGEVVPQATTLRIGELDITQEPSFKWRDRGPGGALWGASSGPVEMHPRELLLGITRAHQLEVELWERRNKWGGLKAYGGHSMGEVFDPAIYGQTHPEYFALVDGKRDVPGLDYDFKHGGQICTSNPEVVRVAVEWVRDFFDRHPEYDAVHLTMNDGRGFCTCDACQALDSGATFTRPGIDLEEAKGDPSQFAQRVLTDRVISFVNRVAEQVQQTHPGKHIMTMAYSQYVMPPTLVEVHPKIIPQYCLWSAYRFASQELKAEMEGIAAAWASRSARMAIYEYAINGSWPSLHRHTPHLWADSLRFLLGQGIDLYQTQSGDEFGVNGLDYYVLGKLLWDTSLDVDKVLADFYAKGFGPAAPAVQRFHRRLEKAWLAITADGKAVDCQSLKETRLPDYLTPQLVAHCHADLDEAEKLADSQEVRQRIAFYRAGLCYSQLTVEAVLATRKISTLGIPIHAQGRGGYPDAPAREQIAQADQAQARELVDAALEAWRIRDELVESLKNDYVISYFWTVYNNLSRRGFYPVPNLKRLAQALEA